jgi:hypothetical protein
LEGHPKDTRAYAWSSPVEGSNKRRFYVLHLGGIRSPLDAVRAAIESEATRKVLIMARKANGQVEVPVHWVDICRVMRMMGLMEDFSKGECLRISALLKKQIEAGTAKKLSRGVYTAVFKDRVTAGGAP